MLQNNLSAPAVPTGTHRLILREATMDDAMFMLKLLTEPSWKRFIGQHEVNSEESAREYLSTKIISNYVDGLGFWVVELKESAKPIGICGLVKRPFLDHIDLGFAYLEEFWGQGYAAEASETVITYATAQLGLSKVLAITVPENKQSVSLLERLGFRYKQDITKPENEVVAVFELLHAKSSNTDPHPKSPHN